MPEGLIFEISHATDPWTPVWVNRTADLIHWETKRGHQRVLGKMEAATARFVLDNAATRGLTASRWDPSHPALPLGNVDEWRPVRLRWDPGDGSGIRPIFYGYLSSLRPAGNQAILEAVDATKFFAQVPVPSGWEIEVLAAIRAGVVTGWWTMGQATGSLVNTITGVAATAEVGATRNIPPLLPNVSQGAVQLNGAGYLVLPGEALSTSNFGATISFKTTPVNRQQSLISILVGTSIWELGIYANNDPNPNLQGRLYVYYSDGVRAGGVSAVNATAGVAPRVDDGSKHTVVATYAAGAVYGQASAIIRIDGLTVVPIVLWPASGGANPAGFSFANGIYIGERFGGGQALAAGAQVDEVVFFNHAGVPLTYTTRLNRASTDVAFEAWGANPYTRIPGLLDVGAWPAALRVAADYTSTKWSTVFPSSGLFAIVEPSSRTLLEHLESAALSFLGEMFIDRAGQYRVYGPGGYPTAGAATFGTAAIPFTAGDPIRTDAFPAVLITPGEDYVGTAASNTWFESPILLEDAAASASFLPRRSFELVSAAATRAAAAAIAAVLLPRVKTPRTIWPKLTVPTNGLPLANRKILLDLELLDRVAVNAAPATGGYSLNVDSRVAGIEHAGDGGSSAKGKWRTKITTTPYV